MDENLIKTSVQKRYAEIVTRTPNTNTIGGCCAPGPGGSGCCGSYPAQQSAILESDLGLSCGLPTRYAHLSEGETVLDLGSGAGVDVFSAASLVGEKGYVIGVDITPQMISRAEELARKNGFKNTEFRLGDIDNIPVDSSSMDVVLSNCVINLVPDKQKVFQEIFRVLKPGGRFCISDIVTEGSLPEIVRQDLVLWAECLAGAMDKEEYIQIVTEAGFENILIHTVSDFENPGEFGNRILSITLEGRKP